MLPHGNVVVGFWGKEVVAVALAVLGAFPSLLDVAATAATALVVQRSGMYVRACGDGVQAAGRELG